MSALKGVAQESHADPKPKLPTEWMESARCHGIDRSIDFFPGPSDIKSVKAAKQFCCACPVIAECLEYALVRHEDGVWGGTSAYERGLLRRKRRTPLKAVGS